ncbi:MAG: hypothetical protein IT300_15325 [Dehalococcoidia bacterium]|nr:hypothetical protein [Dehalococcoidia bacterium]
MAVIPRAGTSPSPASLLAARTLLRAAIGLLGLGLTGFGKRAAIDRQSGKVRAL